MLLFTWAVAGPVFRTPTSAIVPAVVLAVSELFEVLPSGFELLTVAVLSTVLPGFTPAFGLTCKTSVKLALDELGRSAMVHETVPPAPTAGVVQLNVGPLFCVKDTNVVFVGRASVSTALSASAGHPVPQPAWLSATVIE